VLAERHSEHTQRVRCSAPGSFSHSSIVRTLYVDGRETASRFLTAKPVTRDRRNALVVDWQETDSEDFCLTRDREKLDGYIANVIERLDLVLGDEHRHVVVATVEPTLCDELPDSVFHVAHVLEAKVVEQRSRFSDIGVGSDGAG